MEKFNHGDKFEYVQLETFREKGISRPRVRPVGEQFRSLRVEFPRDIRSEHPIGTRFYADVIYLIKIGKKQPYLRADTSSISVVRSFKLNFIEHAILRPDSISGRSYYYESDGNVGPADAFGTLRTRAYLAAKDKLEVKSETKESRNRGNIIREYALARSNGDCEGCEQPAPFISVNGDPYLEAHHIDPVSNDGSDHPRNVAAVCPNCHRRIDRGSDGIEYNEHIRNNILIKEDELDIEYERG